MTEVKPYRTWLPDEKSYELSVHPGQRQVLESVARVTAALAGKQGGKTSVGVDWLLDRIQEHGAGNYLAVCRTSPCLIR